MYSADEFIRQIHAQPDDRTLRAVFADWLQENEPATPPDQLELLRTSPHTPWVDREGGTTRAILAQDRVGELIDLLNLDYEDLSVTMEELIEERNEVDALAGHLGLEPGGHFWDIRDALDLGKYAEGDWSEVLAQWLTERGGMFELARRYTELLNDV